jgi:hypothetical protein
MFEWLHVLRADGSKDAQTSSDEGSEVEEEED